MTICRRVAVLLACAALGGWAPVGAQTTIDGSAEWTFDANASESNGQANDNSAFLQNYSLGLSSVLFDPRVMKFNTEGLFRTSRLTAGGSAEPQSQGRQGDLGYRLGASILPASSLPFFVQASRTTSNSSGDLGPSNPVRSGMIAPTGAPPVDFESQNQTLNLGWQLGLGRLPRVELGYRQGNSVVTGGGYESQQDDEDLSASISKDTARTRQSFRYQRTSFENQLAQTFIQRLSHLDYDLGADLTSHLHLTAHTGQRTTFARSEFAAPITDSSTGAYVPPPSIGDAGSEYAIAGISYEPSGRFFVRLDGTVDRQASGPASTSATLATVSSHLEVVRGLRLTGSGTSGERGQIVDNMPITVTTRSAVGGASYQATVGWLSGTVSAGRGLGTNATREGRTGNLESWAREASLSATFAYLGLGAGYERLQNRDAILDYGNYDSERLRASAQAGTGRVLVSTSADQVRVERGMADTYARNLQRTFLGSASLRIRREGSITASAGGFDNDYAGMTGVGRDRTLFWGVAAQAAARSLSFLVSMRSETAIASQTGFDQRALNGVGRLEYRLRLLHVALEYRHGQSRLQYSQMPRPDDFRGRQLRVSVIRQFGFRR